VTAPTPGVSRRLVLMNPGPVTTDERVRASLAGPDLCHREPEFATLLSRVRSRVVEVCGGGPEHTAVVLTGSGTAAVEAVIASVPPRDRSVLVVDNGHYGRRLRDTAVAYGISVHHQDLGWGTPIDLDAIDDALVAHPGISHVAVVHHETSTGMRNDVAAAAEVAHRHGREMIVDAVSSVGADPVDVARTGLDWVAGSAGKNIEGMPGLGFVCARRTGFQALTRWPPRSYYLDLHRNHTAQEVGGAPAFTPAVPMFYAFDTALGLLLAEGVEARGRRYLALAERLRSGLQAMGLELLLPAEHRANSLTAIRLPAGVSYQHLHDALREEGFVIYAGQEQLARDFFRLSTMGRMRAQDVDEFLAALGRFLTDIPSERPLCGKEEP
jgi:2-aminoethylphosphonate-pyruvate transaminase